MTWWVVNITSLAIMALLSEYLCMRRELREIPISRYRSSEPFSILTCYYFMMINIQIKTSSIVTITCSFMQVLSPHNTSHFVCQSSTLHTLQIGPQIVKCLNLLLYTDLGLISGFSFLFFLLHSLCAGTAKRRIEVHYYQQLNKPVSFFLLLRTGFDDLEWLFF